MGVGITWLNNEKTILCYTFEGNWNWDEMHQAACQANLYMESVNHKVDFIADARNGGLMPSDVISNVQQLSVSVPPHQNYGGLTVFVSTNPLVRTLMSMVGNIYRQLNQYHTFVFAATMDEAYGIISEAQAERRSA